MMNDNYLFGQYVAACYGMNYIETKMYQRFQQFEKNQKIKLTELEQNTHNIIENLLNLITY